MTILQPGASTTTLSMCPAPPSATPSRFSGPAQTPQGVRPQSANRAPGPPALFRNRAPRSTSRGRTWGRRVLVGLGLGLALLFLALLSRPVQQPGAGTGHSDEDKDLWQAIEPGLAFQKLAVPGKRGPAFQLHCFRVDLRHYQIGVADARQKGSRKAATVQVLAREQGAHLGINGTFFDPQLNPLGLLIHQGKRLNPLRRADWGVLFVHKNTPRLVHTNTFRKKWNQSRDISFAIQVGPRLVADSKALRLKPQLARRGALGILGPNRLLVAVNDARPAEANDLAQVMASPPEDGGLGCQDALMVDGGPSAQLFAQAGSFRLSIPGGWGVPNAVVFRPRN